MEAAQNERSFALRNPFRESSGCGGGELGARRISRSIAPCSTRRHLSSRVEGEGMFLKKVDGPRVVTLPDGRSLTRADLPESNGLRWVPQRKRTVAEAVQAGLISRRDAKRTYELTDFELDSWCCKYPLDFANGDSFCKNACG